MADRLLAFATYDVDAFIIRDHPKCSERDAPSETTPAGGSALSAVQLVRS